MATDCWLFVQVSLWWTSSSCVSQGVVAVQTDIVIYLLVVSLSLKKCNICNTDLHIFYTRKILFSKSAFSYFKNISALSVTSSLYELPEQSLCITQTESLCILG